MEGHIASGLSKGKVSFPALALLVSGGHTELVLMKEWLSHQILGETKDDAAGEAFDKAARLLGLPYPGGPQISKLAEVLREKGAVKGEGQSFILPRPMIASSDYNFSFSGLKTALLYTVKKIEKITPEQKSELAKEFEDSVVEVLVLKTKRAIEEFGVKTLIVGGGVSANKHLRAELEKLAETYPDLSLFIPDFYLTTDNAIMIAMAAYLRLSLNKIPPKENIVAEGNLRLS